MYPVQFRQFIQREEIEKKRVLNEDSKRGRTSWKHLVKLKNFFFLVKSQAMNFVVFFSAIILSYCV